METVMVMAMVREDKCYVYIHGSGVRAHHQVMKMSMMMMIEK